MLLTPPPPSLFPPPPPSPRYVVEGKLGWGAMSTVWRCSDRAAGTEVAVKVAMADRIVTETTRDEVKLLRCVEEAPESEGKSAVLRLLGEFEVEGAGGDRHLCLALELLGANLLQCLRATTAPPALATVAGLVEQVLAGIDFLHTGADIIHTDIKPENLLLAGSGPVDLAAAGARALVVKVADLGSACWSHTHFSEVIGTREYRAPEVLLGAEYGPKVDSRHHHHP